jgi:hypothetical protein
MKIYPREIRARLPLRVESYVVRVSKILTASMSVEGAVVSLQYVIKVLLLLCPCLRAGIAQSV